MKTPFTIRLGVAADARSIAQVQTLSWQSSYAGIIEDNFLGSLDADKKAEWWAKAISQGMTTYVAEVGNEIVGFASGGKGRDPINGIEGELYAIYILKEYQGSGIGKALFQTIVQYLLSREIKSMFVWVLKDNPSRGFYIGLGGQKLKEATVKIGDQELIEEAYGWEDLNSF